MKYFMSLVLIVILAACGQDNNSIILVDRNRNKIVDVQKDIHIIEPEDVIISRVSYLKVMGDYIVIPDRQSPSKLVHLFDKNTIKYIGSTGDLGQGPDEISSMASVAYDKNRNELQVVDYGSRRIYCFNIDSIGKNPDYLPSTRFRLREDVYPYEYHYINDTLSYGAYIVPQGYMSYNVKIGKWNMQTGDIKLHEYEYPGILENNVVYDYSEKQDLIVECSNSYDLINYFDSNLNLRLRIMGPNWDKKGDKKQHFLSVVIYKNWVIASYDGEKYSDNQMPKVCHVFDMNGKYIKTLDVGYKIWRMSVDEEKDRLYFSFYDSFTLGYLDLKGILD